MIPHRCPRCNSLEVHRSRRRGWFEMLALRLFLQRPYRCWSCYRRHYASIFNQWGLSGIEQTPAFIHARRPSFQAGPLLLILLAAPFLLAGSSRVLQTLDRLGLSGWRAADEAFQSQSVTPAPPTQLGIAYQEPALRTEELLLPTRETSANRISPVNEAADPAPAPSAPPREPLGALRSAGEVYLNDTKVPGDVTVFLGDTLRTGTGGNAALSIPGKGTLVISQQTQLSFGSARAYFAELKQGAVNLRVFPGAKDLDIQIGNFVVAPDPVAGANADIERAADGSARIRATTGSVGVIGVGEPGVVFITAGQEAVISAAGRLLTATPTELDQAPPVPPALGNSGTKGRRTGLIALGVAGGGAAAVAAALAGGGGGGSKPASPSMP